MDRGESPENPLGKRFSNAREALGMSVSEVADRLHIIPKYVRCIEANQYSQLPGVVFLKGYIRSYARLLGLPEEQVVAQLEEALAASGNHVESADRFAALPPPPPREGLGAALLFLVVLLLAGGAGWYWLNRPPVPEGVAPEGASDAGAVVAGSGAAGSGAAGSGAAGPGAAGLNSGSNGFVDGGAPDEEAYQEGSLAPGSESVSIPLQVNFDREEAADTDVNPDVYSLGVGADTELDPRENPIPDGDEASGVDDLADESDLRPLEPPRSTMAGDESGGVGASATLTAVFSGDCWFDARDRDNERVVQLFRSGQQVSFTGVKPLRVIVGAVDRISLSIDGRPLDLRRYPVRNNRVEFVVEP